jgi:MraZ protein
MALRGGLPFDRAARDLIYGNIIDVSYDNSGRMVIPAYLRAIVGIDDAIYFHAAREVFTLWSPDILELQEGPQWAVAKAACASLKSAPGRERE